MQDSKWDVPWNSGPVSENIDFCPAPHTVMITSSNNQNNGAVWANIVNNIFLEWQNIRLHSITALISQVCTVYSQPLKKRRNYLFFKSRSQSFVWSYFNLQLKGRTAIFAPKRSHRPCVLYKEQGSNWLPIKNVASLETITFEHLLS